MLKIDYAILPLVTRSINCFFDSELSDEYIDFTMMCGFFIFLYLLFLFLCLSSPFRTVKML